MWVIDFFREGGETGRDFLFRESDEGTPIDSGVKISLKMGRKGCGDGLVEHINDHPASSPSIRGRSPVEGKPSCQR